MVPILQEQNLAGLSEDRLILLCQELDCPAAFHELLARHLPWVRHVILKESRRIGLSRVDCEDAQQDAVLAFYQALTKFDADIPGSSVYGRFRIFLRVVVTARFHDFVRNLQRWERHYDRTVRSEELVEIASGGHDGSSEPNDPIALLTWQEFNMRLDQTISLLNPRARQMWEELAAGKSLRAVTVELGMPYGYAKRLRQQILTELAEKLSAWKDLSVAHD